MEYTHWYETALIVLVIVNLALLAFNSYRAYEQ